MWKQSENIVHRLFSRQLFRAPPNTHIHHTRKLYENIVPNHTVYDIECPDYSFRKFTNDGQYLICFSRSHQDLIVYRHKPLYYSSKGEENSISLDLPFKAKKFESYFVQLYSIPLASGNEVICKDFFLSTDNYLYGIFATSSSSDNPSPATHGAVPGVPALERTTIFLVRLADGAITDERVYQDDFIHLGHNAGVFLYDDLLSILSIRHQTIQILQIRETGRFVDVHALGQYCRADDELILNSHVQDEASFQRQQIALRKARGLHVQEDLASVGKGFNGHGNAWPPQWQRGPSQGISSRARPRIGSAGRYSLSGVPNGWLTGSSARWADSGDRFDAQAYGEMNSADLDSQYDHYFRGLFDSLDQVENIDSGVQESTVVVARGSLSLYGQDRVRGSEHVYEADLVQRGGTNIIQENVTGNDYLCGNERLCSINGSRGRQASVGTRMHGLYVSSRESVDRINSGRESPSVWFSSTTMASSGSSGGSDSSRRDMGTYGGSISNGAGLVGNSLIRQSLEGNHAEYVVSSRVQGRASQYYHAVEGLSLPNRWSQVGTEGLVNQIPQYQGRMRARSAESFESSLRSSEQGSQGGARYYTADEAMQTTPSYSERDGLAPELPPVRHLSSAGNFAVASHAQARLAHEESVSPVGGERSTLGRDVNTNTVLGGIKQRLLSFILQGIEKQESNPVLKAQRLKRFYYHFQHYVDLVIWKVQFLDRYHLLIKFGSVDGVVLRNSEASHQTAFLAVYNMETTQMLGFYQNSSEEFLLSFEHFCDHFRAAPQYPLYMHFISSYSNNSHAREQLRKQRAACGNSKNGNSYPQVVKRTLAWLPFNSQCQSPSVYFDQSLFHYDDKLISAMDRHKPCMEHPIKFISRRRSNVLKFKINPGPELGLNDGRVKQVASFIFHPIYPFAISIQQAFMQPAMVNFHFRKV